MTYYVYVLPEDSQYFMYEGKVFHSEVATTGLFYPALFPETIAKDTPPYREATYRELVWGVPVNSVLASLVPVIDRTAITHMTKKEGDAHESVTTWFRTA